MKAVRRPSARVARAVSDSVPPSPLLSARKSSSTYFRVTVMISDQTMSESTPSTTSRVTPCVLLAAMTASRKGVKRTSTYVPIHNPDTPQRQGQKIRRYDVAVTHTVGAGSGSRFVHVVVHI